MRAEIFGRMENFLTQFVGSDATNSRESDSWSLEPRNPISYYYIIHIVYLKSSIDAF